VSAPRREGERLAELSRAIRESSLKRLRRVPAGRENWRPSAGALSISEIARHLLAADEWLFAKLGEPTLRGMVARVGDGGDIDRDGYLGALAALAASGERRARLVAGLDDEALDAPIEDDRFGGTVTVWWVVVRGNLDHEAHHRGQLAAYLRALDDAEETGSR
jgi:uncharacterized damage-inducible protein DinB